MITPYVLDKQVEAATEAFGTVKERTITVGNFKDSLSVLIQRYKALTTAFDKFTTKERQKLADRIYNTKNTSQAADGGRACKIYADIVAAVKSRNDSRVAFEDIIKTAKAISNVLSNFYANANLVFDQADSINIHNTKLSHVSALSVIEEARKYLDYVMCLFNTTTYEIVQHNGIRELAPVAPYRYKFMDDFKNDFIETYNRMSNGRHTAFLNEFKKLRVSKDNIYVSNPNSGSNIPMMGRDKKSFSIVNLILGQYPLNPFLWLGELYNVARHKYYVKLQAEKENLEAHVAMLQMDLADKDPNSEEYAKAVKIIDSYNQMIAELDQKINAYYNED